MYTGAFRPQGTSMLIAVTSSPSAAVQVTTGAHGVRLLAASNSPWVAVSNSSSVLLAIPTTSTPGNGIPLAGAGKVLVETLDIGPRAWLSFGTTAGAAKLHVTPGMGR